MMDDVMYYKIIQVINQNNFNSIDDLQIKKHYLLL